MRKVTFLFLLLVVGNAYASDHSNLEIGRPLRFDDAYSSGLGDRSFGFGLDSRFRTKNHVTSGSLEYKVGFALNQDISLGFDPLVSSKSRQTAFDVSYFYGLQREIGNDPAVGFRLRYHQNLSSGQRWEGLARVAITKGGSHYSKWHLNGDVYTDKDSVRLGAILGYSIPLSVPRRFDQMFVGQIGWEQVTKREHSGYVGFGLLQQVSPTGVFDIGIDIPILGPRSEKVNMTIRAGYSMGF